MLLSSSNARRCPKTVLIYFDRAGSHLYKCTGQIFGAPPAPPDQISKIGRLEPLGNGFKCYHANYRFDSSPDKKALGFFRLRHKNSMASTLLSPDLQSGLKSGDEKNVGNSRQTAVAAGIPELDVVR